MVWGWGYGVWECSGEGVYVWCGDGGGVWECSGEGLCVCGVVMGVVCGSVVVRD